MGHAAVLVQLRQDQLTTLRALAAQRPGRHSHQPVSLVLRELLDEVLTRAPAPPGRQRLRAELGRHQPTLVLLAAKVGNCLAGPDPESALLSLAELQQLSARLLADLGKAPAKGRKP